MIFISDEAEKFGGIQHFCPMEKIWSLDILWYPIHESSEAEKFGEIQHFCPMEKIWSLDILWYPIHESSEIKQTIPYST